MIVNISSGSCAMLLASSVLSVSIFAVRWRLTLRVSATPGPFVRRCSCLSSLSAAIGDGKGTLVNVQFGK
jgi:hypothetical protein